MGFYLFIFFSLFFPFLLLLPFSFCLECDVSARNGQGGLVGYEYRFLTFWISFKKIFELGRGWMYSFGYQTTKIV